MSKYFDNIAATVEVMRYGSNHVTLMGNVNKPGAIEFSQTPTLLEGRSREAESKHGQTAVFRISV